MADRRPLALALTGADDVLFVDEANDLVLTSFGPIPLPPSGVAGELAGTIAGLTTVTADLTNIGVELAGNIGGATTVTADLTIGGTINLAGTIAGTSTVSGVLSLTVKLAGSPGGIGTVAGWLETPVISGQITGQGTVSGALSVTIGLAGTISGQTTVTGNLFQQNNLSGVIGGITSVVGQLQPRLLAIPSLIPTILAIEPISRLSGFINGGSTVSSFIVPALYGVLQGIPFQLGFGGQGIDGLAGTEVAGRSTVTGTLSITVEMAGSLVGKAEFVHPRPKPPIAITASNGVPSPAWDDIIDDPHYASGTAQAAGQWVQFQLPSPQRLSTVEQYCVQGSSWSSDYPRAWDIQGSSDAVFWYTVASDTAAGPGIIITEITTSQEYLYWRIILTTSAVNQWAVNEFYLRLGPWLDVPSLIVPSQIIGQTIVTGHLNNGLLDGDGDIIIELAGTIAGVCTVLVDWPWLSSPRSLFNLAFLYTSVAVGAGFEPTDIYAGADSQTYPDGHVRSFDRFLYLLMAVGAGFDDIDDVSTRPDFISQTFPDGHLRDDFDRFFYLYLNVIKQMSQPFNKLVILPGWTPKTPYHAPPPKGVNQ